MGQFTAIAHTTFTPATPDDEDNPKVVLLICVIYPEPNLMRFDGPASGFEGVDHHQIQCHASHFKLRAPPHINHRIICPHSPSDAPSSARSGVLSISALDVIPTIRHQSGGSQKAHIADQTRIKDDTSRGTKE